MTPERAQQIVEELRGTCRSIDEFLEDGEDIFDETLTQAIDTELFCCRQCEWWCEISEAAQEDEQHVDGDICDQCTNA